MSLSLWRYSLYGGFLAAAGLPIYIHAPKFFVDQHGLSLATIGIALLFLRGLDFLQDPLLGWVVDRSGKKIRTLAFTVACVIGVSMVALFWPSTPVVPLLWFSLTLIFVFSAYSFLSILFYAQGVAKADTLGPGGHVKLATWRESGALIGVCLAAVAPTIIMAFGADNELLIFAIAFALVAITAAFSMRGEWGIASVPGGRFFNLLSDQTLRRLILVGLLNAAPVAVTSTLFLFYVDHRLGSEPASGPLLLLFFLSAALAVPFWGRLADIKGHKTALLWGMCLSVVAFIFALPLGTGDVGLFVCVVIASGAALGADMVLLPALFAKRVAAIDGAAGQAFGMWNFCNKFTLAIMAAIVLPILDLSGFDPNGTSSAYSLQVLSILYAGFPCILKLLAIWVLARTKMDQNR